MSRLSFRLGAGCDQAMGLELIAKALGLGSDVRKNLSMKR